MTRTVHMLVFPDFQLLDATGPIAALEMPTRNAMPPPYALSVISLLGGLVRSSAGVALQTLPLPAGFPDTLMVAGGQGTYSAATCQRTVEYVRAAASHCRRIVSVCSGAYILAAAGLLDGRRATTHWERAQDFQRRFPRIKVEPDRIFVQDGPIWTSAGITAGIDLTLALIAEDVGEAASKRAAKSLVVFHRRPGGQSQYSALLDLQTGTDRIARALSYARQNLQEPLSVEQLAEAACLSPRQFSRTFVSETGQTPAKAIEQLRVEAARIEVESGAHSLEQVAVRVGFKDPERMRRAFLRAFGTPPQALRRMARGQPPAGT